MAFFLAVESRWLERKLFREHGRFFVCPFGCGHSVACTGNSANRGPSRTAVHPFPIPAARFLETGEKYWPLKLDARPASG